MMFLVIFAFCFYVIFALAAPGWHKCGREVHPCSDWCCRPLQHHSWHHGIRWVASSLWFVGSHKRQQVGCGEHLPYFSWGKLCGRYHQQQGLLTGKGKQAQNPRFSQLLVCGGRLAKDFLSNNHPWIFSLHCISGWWLSYQKCFDRFVDQEKWGIQGWSRYLALLQMIQNIQNCFQTTQTFNSTNMSNLIWKIMTKVWGFLFVPSSFATVCSTLPGSIGQGSQHPLQSKRHQARRWRSPARWWWQCGAWEEAAMFGKVHGPFWWVLDWRQDT